MTEANKTQKTPTPTEPPKTAPVKAAAPAPASRAKLLHHAYLVSEKDPAALAEVVTFGTWELAASYALPRKWDVVSGTPGVPITELISG